MEMIASMMASHFNFKTHSSAVNLNGDFNFHFCPEPVIFDKETELANEETTTVRLNNHQKRVIILEGKFIPQRTLNVVFPALLVNEEDVFLFHEWTITMRWNEELVAMKAISPNFELNKSFLTKATEIANEETTTVRLNNHQKRVIIHVG